MTDLNKPVEIKHDIETGDIVDIQLKKADVIIDRMAARNRENSGIDPVEVESTERLRRNAERKRIEAERTERMVEARKRDDEAANRRFLEAQKTERSRRWREEATIHTYPYSQTEPMTGEQLAEAYLEDHPSARSKATPPKPSQVHFKPSPEKLKELAESGKTLAKQMKHVGKAAQKTTEAIEKAFPGHLTHRPFHNLELIVLRDELSKNQ